MPGEAAPSSSSAITPSELSLILHLKKHHWGGEINKKRTFFLIVVLSPVAGSAPKLLSARGRSVGRWRGVGEHSLAAPCTTPQNALNKAFNPTNSRATGAGHRGAGGDAGRRRWRWSEQQQVSQGPDTSVTLLLLIIIFIILVPVVPSRRRNSPHLPPAHSPPRDPPSLSLIHI